MGTHQSGGSLALWLPALHLDLKTQKQTHPARARLAVLVPGQLPGWVVSMGPREDTLQPSSCQGR